MLQGKFRRETGTFLVEGAQAVGEALAFARVDELFLTAGFAEREPELVALADAGRIQLSWCDESAIESLADTRTPQGVVAVVEWVPASLDVALAGTPRLVLGLVECSDPGNLGAAIRVADAVGVGAVVLSPDCVDLTNPKVVRATTGSLFHLPVAPDVEVQELLAAARAGGLRVLATTGAGAVDLDELIDSGALAGPTLWLLGSEAHGLPDEVIAGADQSVRIPMAGRAESLNLATAAAICLYASARAQRSG